MMMLLGRWGTLLPPDTACMAMVVVRSSFQQPDLEGESQRGRWVGAVLHSQIFLGCVASSNISNQKDIWGRSSWVGYKYSCPKKTGHGHGLGL